MLNIRSIKMNLPKEVPEAPVEHAAQQLRDGEHRLDLSVDGGVRAQFLGQVLRQKGKASEHIDLRGTTSVQRGIILSGLGSTCSINQWFKPISVPAGSSALRLENQQPNKS